ncbi:MAG TPA: sodium-dependent transporter [Xanthomonadales bacterium]|nr:sodium-dependent transporter [Xanthomonadales bacterium]
MATSVGGRELWSSRWGFLLASVGFAVGLGNIWRFPFVTGENGGGAFLLIYLVCALLISLPLLISEFAIGRMGRASSTGSYRNVARRGGISTRWGAAGTLAAFCVFTILSYYTVITGWTFDYFIRATMDQFKGLDPVASGNMFSGLTGNPGKLLFWNTLAYLLIAVIIRQGVQKGVERAATVLMPAMFIALATMVVYAALEGDMPATFRFLLEPDFSKVGFSTIMAAVGQAFYSIGIGLAGMIVFGSYLPEGVSIPRFGLLIILIDTAVALLAGFMIFPIVFAFGMEPSAGPGLLFQSLPLAFGQMPGGHFFGSIFFLLLIVAALSSCIGLAESCVAWVDEHWNIPRKKGVLWVCGLGWSVGVLTIMSFSDWSEFYPLDFIPVFEGMNIFSTLDFLAANIFLLLGGLMTSVFIGWRLPKAISLEAMGISDGPFFTFIKVMLRFVVPAVLLVALVMGLIG